MGRGNAQRTGTLGRRAENAAFRYLRDQGLQPVARNFRRRGGEIDLIMLDGEALVFIEVRYRRSSAFEAPGLTVDAHKQRKLIRTAALFTAAHKRLANHEMRFDVVAIEEGKPVDWMRDAFRPDDSLL